LKKKGGSKSSTLIIEEKTRFSPGLLFYIY